MGVRLELCGCQSVGVRLDLTVRVQRGCQAVVAKFVGCSGSGGEVEHLHMRMAVKSGELSRIRRPQSVLHDSWLFVHVSPPTNPKVYYMTSIHGCPFTYPLLHTLGCTT